MEIDRRTFVGGLAATTVLPFPAEAAPDAARAYEPTPAWVFEHPACAPDYEGPGAPDLFKHPHAFSSTARWIQFRETTLLPWVEAEPDNPYPRLFAEQVERILAYREAQPPERQFWRKDAPVESKVMVRSA